MLYSAELALPYVIYTFASLSMLCQMVMLTKCSLDKTSERVAKDWVLGVPPTFSFKRKFINFLQSQYHFFGSCIFWTGAWDLFDIFLWERTPTRDIIYGCVTIILTLVFEQLVSRESLIWLASNKDKILPVHELDSVEVEKDTDDSISSDSNGDTST